MAHILLLEPDVPLANTYATALRSAGHSVQCCSLAQDAVSLADKQRPDLVLLELNLTAHGGIEFLYEFRSYTDWRQVPAVILSHVPAEELAGSRQLVRQLGVAAYLYKPQLSLQALLLTVERVLQSSPSAGKAKA